MPLWSPKSSASSPCAAAIVTVAPLIAPAGSATVMPGSTAAGEPFSPKVDEPDEAVTTGGLVEPPVAGGVVEDPCAGAVPSWPVEPVRPLDGDGEPTGPAPEDSAVVSGAGAPPTALASIDE